ncbi:MAG TPA: AAA family ATPase [Solirubrobacteraceae bacterium]|nr:AAA family ATPase [Solirubrobacteraceae bacterium]
MAVSLGSAAVLRGRADQCAQLDWLIERALGGHSGVLMLRGDAGVGKTALLEYAITSASASALTVVRVAGVESEMELAFAGLSQLCAPVLDRLERVPGPQRDALQTTFGLSAGGVPDRLLVGLAVLSLLSEVAQEGPLLCVIDDAQWLDRASAEALTFVARRMLAEPVVMLFAAREPSDLLQGLPELALEGLADADARALLSSVVPGRLDRRIAEQIIAETRGNPLALLELPRGLSAGQLAGGFGLPGALSLSGRIESSFLRRLEALPEDTRRLLLLAAAEPTGDPALLWRAAEGLAIDARALEPAESDLLIDFDRRVRFRHPLVRSALYRGATAHERREAHRALAEATDARADPDRRAWHLAVATAGANEAVATELERAAARAHARGGLAAAAAFQERAVGLTSDPSLRAERALGAAQTKFEAGALDDAGALLDIADAAAQQGAQRARVDLQRAQIVFASRRGSDAPALLLKAAGELERFDPKLARATYLDALTAARFAGPLAGAADLVKVAEAALAAPCQPQAPGPSDLLLRALAVQIVRGYAAGAPLLKSALIAFEREPVLPPEEGRWLSLALWAAADLWDDGTWRRLTTRGVEHAREVGALTSIPFALSMLSYIHATSGELAAAESLLDEIRAASEATGTPPQPYLGLWIAAVRGREAETRDLIQIASDDAAARGEGFAAFVIEHVTAVLYNGLGQYSVALAALRRQAVDPSYRDSAPRPMAELIEAAVRSGQRELAGLALQRLTETTSPAGTNWALGIEARSRALLSDGDSADALYREAIERLGRTSIRLQLARAHLVYGEWLRRQRRRREARQQLRTALEMFTSMGTEGFADRSERELSATGERARKRSVETRDQLTPQEAQVARLAGDGLSNAEIGARIFVSQTTVAYHLRNVFSKLNIASRHQLGAVLPDSLERPGTPS